MRRRLPKAPSPKPPTNSTPHGSEDDPPATRSTRPLPQHMGKSLPRTKATVAPASTGHTQARNASAPPKRQARPKLMAATSSTSRADLEALEIVIDRPAGRGHPTPRSWSLQYDRPGGAEARGVDHLRSADERRADRTLPRLRPAQIRAFAVRRHSCAGARKLHCGTIVATMPRCWLGSKTNNRSRPRDGSHWRAPCSRAATAPTPCS